MDRILRDNDLLILVLAGVALWWMTRNPSPGSFSPNAPWPGQGLVTDIIPMNVSSAGRAFIKQNEGFDQFPRADAHGTQVIGYGHQIQPGEDYSGGITKLAASDLLDQDLISREDAITNSVTVPINQNQFDALADFVYNVGIGAFQKSTLLQVLNNGNYSGAATQFLQWQNGGRRTADKNLFTAVA